MLEKEGRQVEVPYIDEVFMAENGKLIVNSEKLLEVMI